MQLQTQRSTRRKGLMLGTGSSGHTGRIALFSTAHSVVGVLGPNLDYCVFGLERARAASLSSPCKEARFVDGEE